MTRVIVSLRQIMTQKDLVSLNPEHLLELTWRILHENLRGNLIMVVSMYRYRRQEAAHSGSKLTGSRNTHG